MIFLISEGPSTNTTQPDSTTVVEMENTANEAQTRFSLFCCLRNKNYLESLRRVNRFVLSPDSRVVRHLPQVTCALTFLTTWTIIYQVCKIQWKLENVIFVWVEVTSGNQDFFFWGGALSTGHCLSIIHGGRDKTKKRFHSPLIP